MTISETLDKFDELFGSSSRPAIALMCGVGISWSCLIPASAPIAIPVAGAVVAAYMGARSYDKQVVVKAASADKASLAATDIAGQPGATSTVEAKVPGA